MSSSSSYNSFSNFSTDEEIEEYEKIIIQKEVETINRRREKFKNQNYYIQSENIFTNPYKKYAKFKRKHNEYSQLFSKNKCHYYYRILKVFIWKQKLKILLNIGINLANIVLMFVLDKTGTKDKIIDCVFTSLNPFRYGFDWD